VGHTGGASSHAAAAAAARTQPRLGQGALRRRSVARGKLGVCATKGHAARRLDSRPGTRGRSSANRWIRGTSAASVRTRRFALARGLQSTAPRLLGAACGSALAVCLGVLCVLCGSSLSQQQQQQQNHRGHREHRAEQTEGAAAGRPPATALRVGRRGLSWRRLLG